MAVDDGFWGNTELVYWCLADSVRTTAFRTAILNSVQPGDVVVDLGAGSGILGLTAAEAGASTVYLVENDPVLVKSLERSIEACPYRDQLHLLHQDALSVELPSKVDVVLCELIATGLIHELQVPAMQAVRPFCTESTKVLPESYTCTADLVEKKIPGFGHDLDIVSYDYGGTHPFDVDSKVLTKAAGYATIDFRHDVDSGVQASFQLEILRDGALNGLRISGVTTFPDGSKLGPTSSYSMPLILPLKRQTVKEGDIMAVNLSYKISGGLEHLDYQVDSRS